MSTKRAATKAQKTSDAVKILDQMAGKDGTLRSLSDEARVNALVAQLIYQPPVNSCEVENLLNAEAVAQDGCDRART